MAFARANRKSAACDDMKFAVYAAAASQTRNCTRASP